MVTTSRKLNLKAMLFSSAALLSLAVLPHAVSARSQAANDVGFRPTCMGENFGSVVNSCGSTQRLTYSAPIDATNTTYQVTVRAQGASASNNVTCWGHGVSEDGVSFWQSNTQSLPFFGPSADLAALSVFVPSNGVMNIYCSVLPGGIVWGYHF
jgi:hypothetical protein